MSSKEVPHNIEAEQIVLCCMLISKEAIQKSIERLSKDSFYLEKNGKIFNTIKDLYNESVAITVPILTDKLNDKKILQEVGGVEYLTEVVDIVPTSANVDDYIKIVEDKYILRNLINASTDIATMSYNNEFSINETLDKAESKILNVSKNRRSSEFKTMPSVLNEVQENLEKLSKNKGKISGLSTGYYEIDRLTSGLHENELMILAARPAMGKTALALNIASNVATISKKSVIIFTLEMLAEQLATRMISSAGQIEAVKLQNGNLQTEDWQRVNEAMSQLSNLNIYIDDSPGVTIGDIKSKCRKISNMDPNLGLIVIDYLTLINGNGRYEGNRQQEVSEISRALKTLALELKIPIITLAQLSRSVEAREDKRPVLSDLRESGSIEQDADVVAFLYRDDYYNPANAIDQNISRTEVIIRKNRSGRTGTAELLFKMNTSSFVNYKREDKKEGEISE